MYGYICPYCGDHLDPGERCECRVKEEECMEVPVDSVRHCDGCGCETYPDGRLGTMDGKAICRDDLNDGIGGQYGV